MAETAYPNESTPIVNPETLEFRRAITSPEQGYRPSPYKAFPLGLTKRERTKRNHLYRPFTEKESKVFWSKVDINGKTECWNWMGTIVHGSKGYGSTSRGKSHRVSLQIKLGRDIKTGMHACHTCDNPRCVNPEHLFEGTYRDNMDDMVRKKRQMRGEERNKITPKKLNEFQVRVIRRSCRMGVHQRVLARIFKVCQSNIGGVNRGSSWAHIKQGSSNA